MSWQAQTAVNHHSKQTNMGLFRLLLYLAECANNTGAIDPAPSQDTIAEFFGCTDRTIRNRLNILCDSKELKQTRIGSGPGNPSAYQICLPMPESQNISWPQGGKVVETNPDIFSAFVDFKAETKAEILELKAEISALKVEKVESKGGKGGKERRKGSLGNDADDPYMIHSDPEYIYTYDPQDEKRQEMVSAIAGEVKTVCAIGVTLDDFESVADALIGREVTPDNIRGFADWWQNGNGYYNGKPALKSFVGEIDNYLAGVVRTNSSGRSSNGSTPPETDPYFADIKPIGGLY